MVNQSQPSRCAFCGEQFPLVGGRSQSWRVGDRYACNEFCADGIEDVSSDGRHAMSARPAIDRFVTANTPRSALAD